MPEITSIPLPLPPTMRKPWVLYEGGMNQCYAVYRAEPYEDGRCVIFTFRTCAAVRHRHVALESQDDYLSQLPKNSISRMTDSSLLRELSTGFGVSLALADFAITWASMKHYAIRIGYPGVCDIIASGFDSEICEGDEAAAIRRCMEISREDGAEIDRFWAIAS